MSADLFQPNPKWGVSESLAPMTPQIASTTQSSQQQPLQAATQSKAVATQYKMSRWLQISLFAGGAIVLLAIVIIIIKLIKQKQDNADKKNQQTPPGKPPSAPQQQTPEPTPAKVEELPTADKVGTKLTPKKKKPVVEESESEEESSSGSDETDEESEKETESEEDYPDAVATAKSLQNAKVKKAKNEKPSKEQKPPQQ